MSTIHLINVNNWCRSNHPIYTGNINKTTKISNVGKTNWLQTKAHHGNRKHHVYLSKGVYSKNFMLGVLWTHKIINLIARLSWSGFRTPTVKLTRPYSVADLGFLHRICWTEIYVYKWHTNNLKYAWYRILKIIYKIMRQSSLLFNKCDKAIIQKTIIDLISRLISTIVLPTWLHL